MEDLQVNINEIRNETAIGGNTKTRLANVLEQLKSLNSYSTDEKLTGGTWIDGKPIYRKVLTVLLGSEPTENFYWNSNGLNVVKLDSYFVDRRLDAAINESTTSNYFHIQTYPAAPGSVTFHEFSVEHVLAQGYFTIVHKTVNYYQGAYSTSAVRIGTEVDIIVEYTKTTDPIPE